MGDFPSFIKNPLNAISPSSQSKGIEGYVFDGRDGSQMAVWQCLRDGESAEHAHDYDEYFVVLEGEYTVVFREGEQIIGPGDECVIRRGVPHAGRFTAGTRTIHAFAGKRARRAVDDGD